MDRNTRSRRIMAGDMMTSQPTFYNNINGAVPGTDYDNMSPEELDQLINAAHKLKTGRSGQLTPAAPPPPKRHVDLDAILGGSNA
jgi:hypothetical protein